MHAIVSQLQLTLADTGATNAMAAQLAGCLDAGWKFYLSGELGAGKTHFCRALLHSLGHSGRVPSPTFTLMEPYNLPKFDLYHFDFYRFLTEHDWQDAGFGDWLDDDAIAVVIEWPERAGRSLPPPDLWLRLAMADPPDEPADAERRAILEAHSTRGASCVSVLRNAVAQRQLAGVSFAAG
jgi:tRNA threonylcarbamoyladenosine biosynthesis protein TsaE